MSEGTRRIEIIYRSLHDLVPYVRNARTHSSEQIAKLRQSLAHYGWTNPMLIAGNEMVAGHARLQAALAMLADGQPIMGNPDPESGPTIDLSHLSVADRRAYILADNRLAIDAGWDMGILQTEMSELALSGLDLSLTGFDIPEISALFGIEEERAPDGAGSLAAAFGIPPFTVLNAREGWWQARKDAWLAIGIQSELGRGDNLLKYSDTLLEPDPVKRAERQRARAAA